MPTNKNILVTGGAGFIGSNLIEALLQNKNTVTVVANGYYDSKENVINFLEAGTPVDTMKLKLK